MPWGGKNERANPTSNRVTSPTATTALDELAMPSDAISLVSNITF